jgi:hypothetical protein
MKKERNFHYKIVIIVVGALILTGLIVSILHVSLTSHVIRPSASMYPPCEDTDGGKNIYEAGICLDGGGKAWRDVCLLNNKLKEYYCDPHYTTVCISQVVPCENGCKDGKCVK